MRQLACQGNRREIEGIAGLSLKGLDAALAQHNVGIAAREQILGRQQPLFDAGRRATLEQNRLVNLGEPAQQVEVLHVARTYLQHVRVLTDHLDVFGPHDFGDHRQTKLLAHLPQQF